MMQFPLSKPIFWKVEYIYTRFIFELPAPDTFTKPRVKQRACTRSDLVWNHILF